MKEKSYLESFNKYLDESSQDVKTYFESINNEKIPETTPKEFLVRRFIYEFGLDIRDLVVEKIGFVLVDNKWTKELSDYIGNKKCLEIMCGSGFLSKALLENGVNIIPTDNFSWGMHWDKENNFYTKIEDIDAIEAICKYGNDIDYIIMSWAYMDDTAYRCLLKMREVNPNCKMIVIGEGYGGCTCDDNFFDEANYLNEFEIKIPSWYGIHDTLFLVN